MLPQYIQPTTLCYCDFNNSYNDCSKELLNAIYPGKTMTLTACAKTTGLLALNAVVTVVDNINWLSSSACDIINSSQMVQVSARHSWSTLQHFKRRNTNGVNCF